MNAGNTHLPFPDLERFYEAVAEQIDTLPRDQERLFLAKLCLALAHRVPDARAVEEALAEARAGLDDAPQPE